MRLSLLTAALALVLAQPALAQEMDHSKHMDMDHSKHTDMDMDMGEAPADKMFLQEVEIDGYAVTFHIMKAAPGMAHGGTHDFMIQVEKDGALLDGLIINSKVIFPDGAEASKPLMKMGDWYMTGYDLAAEGKHQLMVLFKTKDGKKHFGGVYYP